MRLLHIYGGNLYGGVERLLASLAGFRGLAPDLEQTFGLCYRGRLWQELEARNAAIHPLGAVRVSRPWQVIWARRRLRRWLLEQRRQGRGFDAVLCHSWWPYAIFGPAARAAGLPVGLWAHDLATGRGWLQRWAGIHRPEMLLACGAFCGAAGARLFPGLEAERLAPPLAFPPAPPKQVRESLRESLTTPVEDVVFLLASRLEPWKGHRLFLQALAALVDAPQWTAWIAGGVQRPHEETYLRSLRELARTLGVDARIRWLGQRDDIEQLMAAADIFVQTNTGPEPFGVVFLEALAAGLPVVTSLGGGADDIVTPACGVTTAPNSVAVATTLRRLLQDPAWRTNLAREAPARFGQISDPRRQMQRFSQRMCLLAARGKLGPGASR